MTTPTTQPAAASERALFEKWASDEWNEYGLRRDFDEYAEEPVHDQWRAWQARAALAAHTPAAGPVLSDERIESLRMKALEMYSAQLGMNPSALDIFAVLIEADLRAALAAQPAPVVARPDLTGLARYDYNEWAADKDPKANKCTNGEYVKFTDVERLFAQPAP